MYDSSPVQILNRMKVADASRVIQGTRHSVIQIREHDGLPQSLKTINMSKVLIERRESSYTASITSSITAYQQENGRRYHAYQAGRKCLTPTTRPLGGQTLNVP